MIHANELRGMAIFESLSLHQLERVAAAAADIDLGDGEYMVHEGEIPAFWVVVEGRLEITKRVGGFERVIATRGYGEHFGEVPLALGSTTFANARAAGHARAMRLEPTMFHELLSLAPSLGSAVSNAIVARVGELGRMTTESPASAATIVGNRQDLACHDLRDFLARNQIPFEWFPPEDELLAERWPELYELRDQGPVAKLRDGAVLVRPTDRELAAALGLCVAPQHDEYDVVIVGGGPGGLAAAVYGASEGLRTVVIENEAPGGQAGTSSRIENYVGFPSGFIGRRSWQSRLPASAPARCRDRRHAACGEARAGRRCARHRARRQNAYSFARRRHRNRRRVASSRYSRSGCPDGAGHLLRCGAHGSARDPRQGHLSGRRRQ